LDDFVGSTATAAGADQFLPRMPHSAVDVATGGIGVVAALVVVRREGWKKKDGVRD
jgi:hypothetical protein